MRNLGFNYGNRDALIHLSTPELTPRSPRPFPSPGDTEVRKTKLLPSWSSHSGGGQERKAWINIQNASSVRAVVEDTARGGAGQEWWGGRRLPSLQWSGRQRQGGVTWVSGHLPANLANTPEFGGMPSLCLACWPTSASKGKRLSEESLSRKGKGVPPKQIISVRSWVLLLVLKAASQESGETPWTSPPRLPSYDRPGTHFLSELPGRTQLRPSKTTRVSGTQVQGDTGLAADKCTRPLQYLGRTYLEIGTGQW